MMETQVLGEVNKFVALKRGTIVRFVWDTEGRKDSSLGMTEFADVDLMISTSGYLEYSSRTTKR